MKLCLPKVQVSLTSNGGKCSIFSITIFSEESERISNSIEFSWTLKGEFSIKIN